MHRTRTEAALAAHHVVTTARLDVRPLTLADAEAFRAMTDEPAITDVVHLLPTPFTLAQAARLIAGQGDGRDCFWGVWPRRETTLIGTVGTHLVGADEIEIGYWFSTAHQGRGFATEAVAGLLAALVEAYRHRRIFAECRPENLASWRLLERLGFEPDGTDGKRDGRKRLSLAGPVGAGPV